MTISPPANVIAYQVLASGVDTLVLAIDVTWKDEAFFNYLSQMKALAVEDDNDVAAIIRSPEGEELWTCTIKPFGSKGHEWILEGSDYSLTIGNWLKPKSRPSIMAQIRSEALWRKGAQQSVDSLCYILTRSGAENLIVKPSRVDLCIDFALPVNIWTADLVKYRVTRANYAAPHFFNADLTGISIGKGKISGRLYNKLLEIKQKSKKYWMYLVWGIETIPDDLVVIRVESQFRRECIKELGVDIVDELFLHLENFWAYFTKDWLKFQDNPGKHPNLRKTFPWWKIVQSGFLGVQGATPLIRCKSLSTKKQQLFAQAYGLFNSMVAIGQEEKGDSIHKEVSFDECLADFKFYADRKGKNEFELNIDILHKRAKYQKHVQKMFDVDQKRKEIGHPSNLPVGEIAQERHEQEASSFPVSERFNDVQEEKLREGCKKPCRLPGFFERSPALWHKVERWVGGNDKDKWENREKN